MKVSVSILKEKDNYIDAIKKVNNSICDYLHLDIMDSSFTEDSSFKIENFSNIERITNKNLDVHLMSTNLDELIDEYSKLNPEFITFHVEIGNTINYINKIKNKGIKVGIAINPETDIEEIYPYLELVDLILIMSVNPGKSAQKFMTSTICKMQELKEIQDRYNFLIEVDGGINDNTINYIKNYADIVVSGSFITDKSNYNNMIKLLKGDYNMEKSKVYFTKEITEEKIVEMYKVLGRELKGNVAVKVHSGEEGNQNYLHPEFMKQIVEYVNGTIVECNTAYEGARNTTEKHEKLMNDHGWTKYFNVDILDSEGPDKVLDIKNGKAINKNYVGKNIDNYDSMLVISHFKGHPMGGYGGALKQLSIGLASSSGKAFIHSAGKTLDQYKLWDNVAEQDKFLESMADSASSVVNYFDGNIVYINIMCNMSVDCDCCKVAEDPCMKDIGILSSTDPIALDMACIDLVYNSNDKGKDHLIERIESRNGTHTIDSAYDLGFGNKDYELITID